MDGGGEASFSGSSFIMHQSEALVLTVRADREVRSVSALSAAGILKMAAGIGERGTTQAAIRGQTFPVDWRVGVFAQWSPKAGARLASTT